MNNNKENLDYSSSCDCCGDRVKDSDTFFSWDSTPYCEECYDDTDE